MFKIGDFSNLTRVSIRMLRYYDEVGLFSPEKTDDFTGYRYYSAHQINNLNIIIRLRDIGFKVSEISEFIKLDSIASQQNMLEQKKLETFDLIKNEKSKINMIDFTIMNLNKENKKMSYKIEIRSIPSYKVIGYRQNIEQFDQEGILWGKIGEYMGRNRIQATGICYSTYYDCTGMEEVIDAEVVLEVAKLEQNRDGFTFYETNPIEKAACLLVSGDYYNISPAFEYLAKWMEDNEYEIAGDTRQVSIKSPDNESNPDNYLTEIQIPIK